MPPKDADGKENFVDPNQTTGAVWAGSTLFGKTCLSKNLGSSLYSL